MAAQLKFSGFGSFRGWYSVNPGAGQADAVLVVLPTGPAQKTYVSAVAVSVIHASVVGTTFAGWFADWIIVSGIPDAIFSLGPSGTAIVSGSPTTGAEFGLGTGAPTSAFGAPYVYNIQGVKRELASGRVSIAPLVAAAPWPPPENPTQYTYIDDGSQPQGEVGDPMALVLLGPYPLPIGVTQTAAFQFAFQIDIHGGTVKTDESFGPLGMRRPLPRPG